MGAPPEQPRLRRRVGRRFFCSIAVEFQPNKSTAPLPLEKVRSGDRSFAARHGRTIIYFAFRRKVGAARADAADGCDCVRATAAPLFGGEEGGRAARAEGVNAAAVEL